jgi:RNA polymerase sigma-70 factor (ECF subfamily)
MLGDRSEAEDLVHDVFLEVWRQAAGYEPARGTVRSWLLVRLRGRALDRIRLRRLRAPTAPTEPPVAPAVDPDGATVVRALAALPEDQRRALELAYWRGLSAAEIAALGEAPLGTVKSRISTGMAKLRIALSDPSTEEGAT